MLTRRTFLHTAAAGLAACAARGAHAAAPGETLYNGVTLPATWPPRLSRVFDAPVTPPYLADPPAVIPIDVGRQLFVDDFLIARTNLNRRFHHARYDPRSPVLVPERPWEVRDEYADRTQTRPNPTAMPLSDGVFFDPVDRLFKLWYMAGYQMTTCLAVSEDGLDWRRPVFDVVPGTNIVDKTHRDSSTVWLDLFDPDPARRYKFAFWRDHQLTLHTSPDGVHWRIVGTTPPTGDRSTFFFNPFRRKWVFSLRGNESTTQISGRFRRYWEHDRFEAAARDWAGAPPVPWVKADARDPSRLPPPARSELYNLDCVAYESVLLGLFTVWRGESSVREKINEVVLGFSRDGFHWQRPDRRAFLPVADTSGAWNYANVQSAGGCCLVVGDELFFYVSGRTGRPGTDEPGTCTTGLARLRRDGFASMDWLPDEAPVLRGAGPGTLTTRPVRFSGAHAFINADLRGGRLRAAILDVDGTPIAPFTLERCRPLDGDGTRLALRWEGARDLGALAGRTVRVHFEMTRGRLYAFWVSSATSGESGGYPGAGGPGFNGPIDRPA